MIRHISALAAVVVLSLSSVACVASQDDAGDPNGQAETSQDLAAAQGAYFETFEGSDGRHYFRVVAANGETVLQSQGYASASDAREGITAVIDNAVDARNYEMLTATDGQFYFDVKAPNGEIIGSSELYSTKASAERGARTVRALVRIARQSTLKIVPGHE